MGNSKYLSGRRAEYELQNFLKSRNMTVLRMSGSHGAYDLIAFGEGFNGPETYCIQVKSSHSTASGKSQKKAGEEDLNKDRPYTADRHDVFKILAERSYDKKSKQKWKFSVLLGGKTEIFRELENKNG